MSSLLVSGVNFGFGESSANQLRQRAHLSPQFFDDRFQPLNGERLQDGGVAVVTKLAFVRVKL
jgi:hypothetical protein